MTTLPASSPPDELAPLLARLRALEALLLVARELTAELELESLLEKILRAAIEVSESTAGSLFLHDPATNELVFRVIVGGGGEALKNTTIPVDRGIAGECFSQQRVILVEDAETDPRYLRAPAASVGMQIHQLLAVPLVRQGKAIGVLEVMNRAAGKIYAAADAELLMAFASQSAIAIDNARLYGEVLQERDRILAVEAAVRHELARDLHDGPTQLLSALIMEIRYLRDRAAREDPMNSAEFLQLEALAQKALYQTRNILFDLRPVILEQRGLGPALEQYVTRLRMVEPFKITLNASPLRTRFEPKVEAALFSVVQEAVNNARKHARPANVWIDAMEDEECVTITIRDDGRGFDVAGIQENYGQRGSLGLLNMKERAEIARGKLEFESRMNEGTRVRLIVPLTA